MEPTKETPDETLLRCRNEVATLFNKQSGVPYKDWEEMIRLLHDKPDAICDRYNQVCKRYHSARLSQSLPKEEEMKKKESIKFAEWVWKNTFRHGDKYLTETADKEYTMSELYDLFKKQ